MTAWPATLLSKGSGAVASGIGTVAGEPAAAIVTTSDATEFVFAFHEGRWRETESFPFTGTDFVEPTLTLVDLNQDGSDELLTQFSTGRTDAGELRWWSGTAWEVAAMSDGLQLRDKQVVGFNRPCIPDCASGPEVMFEIFWDGKHFTDRTVDSDGNPILVFYNRPCAELHPVDVEPLTLCDEGPAVQSLQNALIEVGFTYTDDGGPFTADGQFGPDTSTSLRLYQLSIGVKPDGIAQGQWYHDLIESGFQGD